MPSVRISNGLFIVVDAGMRSTGSSGKRRFNTADAALTAAKRMLDEGDETTPVYVAQLISKIEAPKQPKHTVTEL